MLLNIINYLSALFLFQSRILFWIWAALPQPELNNYRYEIHFDIPPNMKPLRQHYSGTVKSLEISASELTQVGRNIEDNFWYSSESKEIKLFKPTKEI